MNRSRYFYGSYCISILNAVFSIELFNCISSIVVGKSAFEFNNKVEKNFLGERDGEVGIN